MAARRSGSLRSPTTSCVDMLYVHPAAAGQGGGAMLLDAMEKLAAARGAKEITVDVSDTARGFFEKRGYAAKSRNTVTVGGEWLANTTMIKPLAGRRARMTGPDTPFPRHWLYYLILKYAVIAAAVAVSLYTVYRLYRG